MSGFPGHWCLPVEGSLKWIRLRLMVVVGFVGLRDSWVGGTSFVPAAEWGGTG